MAMLLRPIRRAKVMFYFCLKPKVEMEEYIVLKAHFLNTKHKQQT